MKLLIVIPALINDERHVEMIRVQSLLADRLKLCQPEFKIISVLVCDYIAPCFKERICSLGNRFDRFEEIDNNGSWAWGIRNPTTRAIQMANEPGCTHILRVIQDTFVFDVETLADEIQKIKDDQTIGGHIHNWPTSNHFGYCDEMGLEKRNPLTYVHGAVMFAPLAILDRYY